MEWVGRREGVGPTEGLEHLERPVVTVAVQHLEVTCHFMLVHIIVEVVDLHKPHQEVTVHVATQAIDRQYLGTIVCLPGVMDHNHNNQIWGMFISCTHRLYNYYLFLWLRPYTNSLSFVLYGSRQMMKGN